ncbi:MAG: phosphoribosyltransferase family protein [Patescibacteria group bacterium]|jgi:orotate phosphoribosyltransferase
MKEEEVSQRLARAGAVITNSHIVYTSGRHGTAYVNKDAIYPHTQEISDLCRAIAEYFVADQIEVVIAPAIGGVILSQWTAHHLTKMTGRPVLSTYAQKSERSLYKARETTAIYNIPSMGTITLLEGEELAVKENCFVIERGYDKLVTGKNVLVVEDILTTGGSVRKVIATTRALGGKIVGLGALCNRGGIKPSDVLDPPQLYALLNVKLDSYDEADCPLCAQGIPINTDVGKGKEFLARKQEK